MGNASIRSARPLDLRWAILFSLGLGLVLLTVGAQAVDLPLPVMKVEEDWELVILEPSTETAAPQVTCVLSPQDNLDGIYATLEINHASLPDFSAGGLQLQVWNGEEWLTVRDYDNTTLENEGEVVTWTRRMSLDVSGKLTFHVTNGNSTTWGAFGSGNNVKLSLNTTLVNLNGYTPELSQVQSGVGYGSQRVASLKLKAVRYYDVLGNLMAEDTTERVIHQE